MENVFLLCECMHSLIGDPGSFTRCCHFCSDQCQSQERTDTEEKINALYCRIDEMRKWLLLLFGERTSMKDLIR